MHKQDKIPAISPSSEGGRLLRSNWRPSKVKTITFVLALALVGVAIKIISFAGNYTTATDANTVIVQYSFPHVMMPVSSTNLAAPMTSPFTLYGNGLLVCSSSESMTGMTMPANTDTPNQLTSTTLSQSQIHDLIQNIANTGFMQLDHEYYKLPIMERQYIIRVNTQQAEHYVLYYNDVPAPEAYTKTVSLLKDYCSTVTTPYQPDTVTLRIKKNANPKGQSVAAQNDLSQPDASPIVDGLNKADAAAEPPSGADPTTLTSPGEVDQTVTGGKAKALLKHLAGKTRKFVKKGNTVYEVGVDQKLPKINNPLKVDYKEIRANKKSGALGFLKNKLVGTAHAAGNMPVRVVLLLPADGGSTGLLAAAQQLGQAQHDWYCGQVGACYQYQGVTVMRGSQTQAYYNTCHSPDSCGGNQLLAVLYNVSERDFGTIYRQDVDTLVIPGWATNTLSLNACGWGFVGSPLGVADLYTPGTFAQASLICQHGQTMAHESGHTFGLNHTGNGTLMDGSPYSQYAAYCDIGSTLEPACRLDSTQAATLKANTTIFTPGPTLVPLWQYWNNTIHDHFYTISRNDPGYHYYGYNLQQCTAKAYNLYVPGTVPLWRYWNSHVGDHFYTTGRNDPYYAYFKYWLEGYEGYVYPPTGTHPAGWLALRRYYNPTLADHFYTTLNMPSGSYGYNFESVEGWVAPC